MIPEPSDKIEALNPGISTAPYRVYNIGNNQPVELMTFIETLENAIGKKAEMDFLPMQPGDVHATYADVSDLMAMVDFKPSTTIEEGLNNFARWYRDWVK